MNIFSFADIHQEMSKHLDIKSIYNLCTLNKEYYNLWKSVIYWKPYYLKNGFQLPNFTTSDISMWLLDLSILKIMNNLQLKNIDFVSICLKDIDDIDDINVLNIEGVDFDQITKMYNEMDYCTYTNIQGNLELCYDNCQFPEIILFHKDDKWKMSIDTFIIESVENEHYEDLCYSHVDGECFSCVIDEHYLYNVEYKNIKKLLQKYKKNNPKYNIVKYFKHYPILI